MDKNRQKILFIVTQSQWGGAQRYVFDLAVNLKKEAEIAVAFGGNGELLKRLNENNIKTIPLAYLKREISPLNDIKSFFELLKIIKREKPDIIHLNSSKAGILGSLAAKMLGVKKIIYTSHGWVFNEPLPWWLKKLYFYAEKISALWKDKIICVSEFDYQTALNSRFCHPKKLITIHNGIDKIDFLPKEEARDYLNSKLQIANFKQIQNLKLEIPNNRKIIGCVANLYKNKGLTYLIEAAKIINNPEIIFAVIGEGEEFGNLKLQIANCKLEDRVKLLGSITDSYRYLKAFDLFVLPSIKEGLPYTILEAMAAQIPIIATRVGGIPEMIENNKTGVLVKARDNQDLAEKIIAFFKNKTTAQKYSLEAYEKLRKEFTLKKMVGETKKVYFS